MDANRSLQPSDGRTAPGPMARAAQTSRTPGTVPTRVAAIDHVQLAMPPDGEDAARRFYGGVLGLAEMPKPPALAVRGGCWFEAGDVKLHLGVEHDFRPARKAHPALIVNGLAAFVAEHGLDVRWGDEIPGVQRCHVDDPFGNRIELIDG